MPDWFWVQQVVFPILGMAMGAFALFGIYKTVNHWLDRRHERELAAQKGAFPHDLDEIKRRLDALDDVAFRVEELEERLDFTERILARHTGQERLGRGQ